MLDSSSIDYLYPICVGNFVNVLGISLIFPSVEAIRMVERGDASPEDIDQAMELGAGYREYSAP